MYYCHHYNYHCPLILDLSTISHCSNRYLELLIGIRGARREDDAADAYLADGEELSNHHESDVVVRLVFKRD